MGSVVKRFSGLLFLFLFLPLLAKAQTATLTGTVSDATGASVAGATVTAKNIQTNATRTATTTDTGLFRIPSLTPAVYEVVFEKDGFQSIRYTNVVLTVDQVLTLDAKLQVSAVAQTVEVNGQTVAPIELDNASISNVVDQKRIQELPLILRDPYQLVLLSAGTIQSNSGLGGFAVDGQRERNNNFLLDGADNNDADVPTGGGGLTPLNPDSAQEFRVITNNFLPEFGRNSGAIIDVVTRSGSNDLHGSAYWFGRYNALAARDFFNPGTTSTGQASPQDPFVRNIFGGSAGGKIIKDKTFWFVNYEGDRFVTTLTNQSTVPTAAFTSGIFTFNGTPVNITTPGSAQNATGLALDPTIHKLLSLFPTPNGASVDSVRGILNFASASRFTQDTVNVKVDHNINANEKLTARYSFDQNNDPNSGHFDFLPGAIGGISVPQRVQNAAVGLTSTIGSTLVNELRFGANRNNAAFNCNGVNLFDSFGGTDAFGRGRDFTLPGLGTAADLNTFGCGVLGDSNGQQRFTGTYQTSDTLTKVKGKHSFKGGFDFRDVYSNNFDGFFSRAQVSFNGFSTFSAPSINLNPAVPCSVALEGTPQFATSCGSVELQDLGWLLVGGVANNSQAEFFDHNGNRTGSDLRGFRQRELRLFIQDSYKITSRLTLNYGLAWAFNGVPFEVNNNFSTLGVDPSSQATSFTFNNIGPGSGGQFYRDDLRDFEPRLGFAWDPFGHGKTAIRGAYGIFHDRTFGNLLGNARSNPPFQQTFQAGFGAPTPLGTVGAPANLAPTSVVNAGLGSFIQPVLLDQDIRSPMIQSWNLGIQHEVLRNLTVDVSYVGNHATRLFRQVDGNPPQPGLVSQLEAFCVPTNPNNQNLGGLDAQGNPLPGQCSQGTLQGFNLFFGKQLGLLPFNAANNNAFFHTLTQKTVASSNYNALQLNVTKQFANGFQIQGAYTWSHTIDDSSDPIVAPNGNNTFPVNSFNLAGERGNSGIDVRQRAVINYIYEFPFGRGRAHLSNGFLGRALEGWRVSGITTFSGGQPFDILQPLDTQHTGINDRAQLIGNPAQPAGTDVTFTGPALSAFASPAFGTVSNLGRNHFYGPGVKNFDATVQKLTSITERMKLEFRVEAFNIFNRVQFGTPDNNIVDGASFGQSTSEVARNDGTTGARQLQVALKLTF
jgi:hypothetical protein